jgi:hypothetical protein
MLREAVSYAPVRDELNKGMHELASAEQKV